MSREWRVYQPCTPSAARVTGSFGVYVRCGEVRHRHLGWAEVKLLGLTLITSEVRHIHLWWARGGCPTQSNGQIVPI